MINQEWLEKCKNYLHAATVADGERFVFIPVEDYQQLIYHIKNYMVIGVNYKKLDGVKNV